MKIEIARVPPDGLEVSEDIDVSDLDLERPDLRFVSLLKANSKLIKTVNVVSAEVSVNSRTSIVCSRCLEEKEKDFTQTYKFNFEINPSTLLRIDAECNRSIKTTDRFIDLEPVIREEIMLSYPLKLLCKSDCQGLCPSCGKDLNKGQCNCQK